MSYQDVSRRIREYPGRKLFDHGATQSDISSAEGALGRKLPGSYKAFLREFGWGGIDLWEMYGVGAGVPKYVDLVRNSESERTMAHPHIPPPLIPILNDGFGNNYCLDTGSLHDGECPVVFWDHEKGARQEPEVVSPRFDMRLLDMLGESGAQTPPRQR